MSWITEIILYMGGDVNGEMFLAEVNKFVSRWDPEAHFTLVDDKRLPKRWYSKQPLLDTLAIGAFNKLNLDLLIAHLRTIEWPYPEFVQLIVKDGDEPRFRVIDIFPELASQDGDTPED